MLLEQSSDADRATRGLRDAVAQMQRTTARATDDAAALAVEALRAADRLIAAAVGVIGRGGFASGAGLPAEMMLRLDARMTGWDARAMTRAATALTTMPDTGYAFEEGLISWSQVRGIVSAAKGCDAATRRALDRGVARHLLAHPTAHPEELVRTVEDDAAAARRDRTERREERAVESGFVSIQPSLDGRASLYAEGDAQSIATIAGAIDRHAGPPPSGDEPITRARQRFDALLAIAEQSLNGAATGGRPRPRVLATVDIGELARDEGTARLLWSLTGRAPRLSPIGTHTLLCDADVLPVLFERGTPIAIGEPANPIPRRIRRAVQARDQGCRFPGCDAPLAWTDLHHIVRRSRGGPSTPDNLISLCRRCHRRIHKRGWTIRSGPAGSFIFTHRRRRYEAAETRRRRAPADDRSRSLPDPAL